MPSLALVVMAAGIGSRYGGLKQIAPVGPGGEIIIDYSVYDALRTGFDHVVFIIRKEMEDQFRDKVGRKIEPIVEVDYVFQSPDQLPPGFTVPEGRIKNWGTAQAVLVTRDVIQSPFVVINADDFYGRTSFEIMAGRLRELTPGPVPEYAMLGYKLVNTLSDNGHVTRGVCSMGEDGYLLDICERFQVRKIDDDVRHTEDGETWSFLPLDAPTSMNFWGFTPDLFADLELLFPDFLKKNAPTLDKFEFLIPDAIGELVREGRARVKILGTGEKWFGVTYPEDLALVQNAIAGLVRQGAYPADLWAGR
jgi:dTDP-glucose pyrophosphorylase